MTFEETGLNPCMIRVTNDLGFKHPTPVQKQTIPHLLGNSDKDLLANAQIGTGKTAAFGLPVIQQVDDYKKDTQCLILAPTRELCMQITNDLKIFSKYREKINIVPVYLWWSTY